MVLDKKSINKALIGHCVMVSGYIGGVVSVATPRGKRPILVCVELGTGCIRELDVSDLYQPKCPEVLSFLDNLDPSLKDKIKIINNENIYYVEGAQRTRLKSKERVYKLVRDKPKRSKEEKRRRRYPNLPVKSSAMSAEPRPMHILPWE